MSNIEIVKPSDTHMCEVGYHIVKGHYRKTKDGRTWVDVHRRKNRGKSKKITFYPENLLYLYWNSTKKYKKINVIKGFKPYHELDSVIQFWLDYWQSKFKKLPKIDPLLIKSLIAQESSFNPKADPNVSHSSAYGLMQIVDKTRIALTGKVKSSVTQDYINTSRKDLEDPVINIAVGTRWLVVKYFNAYRRKGIKIHNMIKIYYGGKSEAENEEYLQKILKRYSSSGGTTNMGQ
ncbi:MAG: transglycosylase SLT domain-containing protein [Bacteriovoracaceae bacterium]|nr:transglycosylase SLT domain-containing protein [Bacteriovoracaceae bacterium]